jgi:rfaE bifunctional protein nucleotidyltransferase chain/domain
MTPDKICSRDAAVSYSHALQSEGKTVVYTSGVFDLLHRGHVEYLERARALGDALVVGLNSDESVRLNKGPTRPVCTAQDRAVVLAGLQSVDRVFIFSERNNNKNIELIRPSIYAKASDYGVANLSSAPIVESYGGRVELITVTPGFSTTTIIAKILASGISEAGEGINCSTGPYPVLFLDRDGTIIEHREYLSDPEQVRFLPGALEGIKQFYQAGYKIVLVTNQPGIGLGYFSTEDLFRVNSRMLQGFLSSGILVDKIYFCPHSQSENCECRKPGTGLFKRAQSQIPVDLARSVMIGDTSADIEAGTRFGITTALVLTGKQIPKTMDATPTVTVKSIAEAASKLLHPVDCSNT